MTDVIDAPPKTCFVAMPLTTRSQEEALYHDEDHWKHLFDELIRPAIEAAGFLVLAPGREGSEHITQQIVKDICTADLMVCDLSSANANVFFEFGLRTSLNLPVAVIHDRFAQQLPFDVHAIHALTYRYEPHTMKQQLAALTAHVNAAMRASAGGNTFWGVYGASYTEERDDAIRRLINALDAASAESAALRSQLGDAPQVLAHLKEVEAAHERLEAELQVRDRVLAEKDRSSDALTRGAEQLRERIALAETQLASTTEERDKLRGEVTALSRKADEATAAVARLELAKKEMLSPWKWIGGIVAVCVAILASWAIGGWPARFIHVHPSAILEREPGSFAGAIADTTTGAAILILVFGILFSITDPLEEWGFLLGTVVTAGVVFLVGLGVYAVA